MTFTKVFRIIALLLMLSISATIIPHDASATLPFSTSRNEYIGNGNAATYPYTFKIFSKNDLKVIKTSGGTDVTLTVDTDYTVAGVGNQSGGSITLTAGNLASGESLTIRRVRPITQTTDIRNQGPFFPKVHEDAFDHFIMVDQQQQDELDRSIKVDETVTGIDVSLPTPEALKILRWNASATGIEAVSPGELPSSVTTFGFGLDLTSGNLKVDTSEAVGVINVTDPEYGASPSASAAVNAQAFQDAIDALPENGGTIVVPSTTGLTIGAEVDFNKDNVHFLGLGGKALIIQTAGNFIKINASNLTFENIHFKGAVGADRFASNGSAVAENVEFINVRFEDFHLNIADTIGFLSHVLVDRSEIGPIASTINATGITINNVPYVTVRNSEIHHINSTSSGEGIKITGVNTRNTQILGNDIHHNARNGIDGFDGAYFTRIIGNDIHHNTSSGVELKQPGNGSRQSVFAFNKVFDNGALGARADGDRLLVFGNEFDNNTSHGLDIGGQFSSFSYNRAKGNGGRGISVGGVGQSTVSNAVDNGSGLIRITATAHGFSTNQVITIEGVVGTTEANSTWQITKIDADTFDLVGSTFTNAYVSGGTATGLSLHDISHNQIEGNASDALVVSAAVYRADVNNNKINANSQNGIVNNGKEVTAVNNTIINYSTPMSGSGTYAVRRGNKTTSGLSQGRAVLVSGTVTVSTKEVLSADNITLTRVVSGGTVGHLSVGTITAGTSFVINSSSGSDTSTIFWEIVH